MLIPKFPRASIAYYILISLCGLTQVTGRSVHDSPQDQARTWIHAAMNALGGEDRLREIYAIEIKGIGFRNELEQSERLALEATDLHAEMDTQLHDFTQHVVAFTWKGERIRLFLSSYSSTREASSGITPRPS